jgi:excisionase family DNA binding protein
MAHWADRIAGSRKALTAYELAELLSVSAISVFRLAKKGVLPAFRVGTSLRFCPAAIARWLRERGGSERFAPLRFAQAASAS